MRMHLCFGDFKDPIQASELKQLLGLWAGIDNPQAATMRHSSFVESHQAA